jgi:hypothetical protein
MRGFYTKKPNLFTRVRLTTLSCTDEFVGGEQMRRSLYCTLPALACPIIRTLLSGRGPINKGAGCKHKNKEGGRSQHALEKFLIVTPQSQRLTDVTIQRNARKPTQEATKGNEKRQTKVLMNSFFFSTFLLLVPALGCSSEALTGGLPC